MDLMGLLHETAYLIRLIHATRSGLFMGIETFSLFEIFFNLNLFDIVKDLLIFVSSSCYFTGIIEKASLVMYD